MMQPRRPNDLADLSTSADAGLDASGGAGGAALTAMPVFGAYLVVYFIFFGVVHFALPRFEQVYSQLKGPLPEITVMALRFATWFRDGYGWLFLLPIPMILPALTARQNGPRRAVMPWRMFNLT